MSSYSSYKILWTDYAFETVNAIVDYLRKDWSEREVNLFLDEIDRTVNAIRAFPKLFKASSKRKNVHLALIDKHSYLVYQIRSNKNQIVILQFWSTQQNPGKLRY